MAVRRIVANIATDRLDGARAFYGDLLGMNIVMNLGWIMTFAADGSMTPQISVAIEGGSGTTVPDLSIEVDDLSDVHRRMRAAGFKIEYGPVTEPWDVTRFFVAIHLGAWSTSWNIADKHNQGINRFGALALEAPGVLLSSTMMEICRSA